MVKGPPSVQRDFQRQKDARNERQDRERQYDRDHGIRTGGSYPTVRPNFNVNSPPSIQSLMAPTPRKK